LALSDKVRTIERKINDLEKERKEKEEKIRKEKEEIIKYGADKKYVVEFLLLGGIGSRLKQVTAWSEVEQWYFPDPELWAVYSFNSGGDLFYYDCPDGYETISCGDNGKAEYDETVGSCLGGIPDNSKNDKIFLYLECEKIE
jgi:hypothetical protein